MFRGPGKRKTDDREIKQVEYISSIFGESDIFKPIIVSFDGRRYRKYVATPVWGGANGADTSGVCGKVVPTSSLYPEGEDACVDGDDEVYELGEVERVS